MGGLMGALNTVGGWAKTVTDLGLTVITAAVVVEVLYPGSDLIIDNIAAVVDRFGDGGLSGLILVLLFLVLYRRD